MNQIMTKEQMHERLMAMKNRRMFEDERLETIRTLFKRIKKARDLFEADIDGLFRDEYDSWLKGLDKIYSELQTLGVPMSFSTSLFVFGPDLTREFVEQFDE